MVKEYRTRDFSGQGGGKGDQALSLCKWLSSDLRGSCQSVHHTHNDHPQNGVRPGRGSHNGRGRGGRKGGLEGPLVL